MSAPEELRVPGYEILAKIAEGASSVVYRARCVRTEREAAIKVPLPHADLERLLNGLRAHASLSHPNIVSLWEADQLPGGRAYVTMSLIKGRTLAEIVRDRGAPLEDRDRFVVAFDQVCRALAYAHRRGVMHLNLTPWKVMIGESGEVAVVGWGRARAIGAPEPPLTRVLPTMIGAPVYAAPEQIRGQREDARTDVFGLGGLLCFLLTGKPTHASDAGVLEIVKRCVEGDFSETFARLDACGADAELIAVAKRCLAPNPADRFADAGEVATAVAAYRRDERPLGAEIPPVADRRGRHRWGVILAFAVGAVISLLINANLLWRR